MKLKRLQQLSIPKTVHLHFQKSMQARYEQIQIFCNVIFRNRSQSDRMLGAGRNLRRF